MPFLCQLSYEHGMYLFWKTKALPKPNHAQKVNQVKKYLFQRIEFLGMIELNYSALQKNSTFCQFAL